MPLLPLRPNVCMLLFNREGKLLLGERLNEPGVWQLPQGGIEAQTSPEESVLRELEEELGLPRSSVKIIKKLDALHEYEFRKIPDYARGRWRGQSQTFWLVELTGTDADINLHADKKPEFSAYRWCTPDEVRGLAQPLRVPGYEAPLKEFEAYLASMGRGSRRA